MSLHHTLLESYVDLPFSFILTSSPATFANQMGTWPYELGSHLRKQHYLSADVLVIWVIILIADTYWTLSKPGTLLKLYIHSLNFPRAESYTDSHNLLRAIELVYPGIDN
jgi:hypothetical protein